MRNGRPVLGVLFLAATLAACQTAHPPTAPVTAEATTSVQEDQRTRDLYLSAIEQLIQYDKFHAALAHIDEFELRFGPNPRTHALRGDAWLALGEFDRAEKEYGAIERGTLAGAGHHGLGSVAAKRGNWALAATQFEDAVETQPTNTKFLTDLSHAYAELGRDHDAEFALKQAQELSPEAGGNETRTAAAPAPAAPTLSAGEPGE